MPVCTAEPVADSWPVVPFGELRDVWFQIGGTICNLRCAHCFISCAPDNHAFGFMTLEQCRGSFAEALELGGREFYFTGGEPFANPAAADILVEAVGLRPSTVLTNAMLQTDAEVARIAAASRRSGHEFTWRVSLDGHNPAMNDAIRGEGVFEKTTRGIGQLVRAGFRPIITTMRSWCGCDEAVLGEFRKALAAVGYDEPRLKVLPSLKLGAEVARTGPYPPCAKVTHQMMAAYDPSNLLCHSARLVTDRGVWVCPILPDSPEARMGDSLAETLRPYPLRHAACHTCWSNGAICSNVTR